MSLVMFHKTTTRRQTDESKVKPNGVDLNKKDIRDFRPLAQQFKDAEAIYLRENDLSDFDPYITMERLKILDLSLNSISGTVSFLNKTPILRHLFLTSNKIDSFEGINGLRDLETLCISDNQITSFQGLDKLPNLRVLSMNYNQVSSFQYFPHLPQLHTLNLIGNPLAQLPSYRGMAIALCPPNLVRVDSTVVMDEERAATEHYRGKISFCVAEGFIIENESVEEAAEKFLLNFQRSNNSEKPLQLQSIHLSSTDSASNVLTESVPVKLEVCLQDVREYAVRTKEIFHSPYLFPVVFKASGEAKEAFVVGSMNQWTDPIPLERVEEATGEVFFHATLYLPAGEYEYRYILDGEEKVTEENIVVSRFKQGECNLYRVEEPVIPPSTITTTTTTTTTTTSLGTSGVEGGGNYSGESTEDNEKNVLYIRWMHSDVNNGFQLIDGVNGLAYTPKGDDIGFCLRAEVVVFENGVFSFQYFDVSTPVSAGAPLCERFAILGTPAEGEVLTVESIYSGGNEGQSELLWFRVYPSGEEIPLNVPDAWKGYELVVEDIGCRIRGQFTPVRDDSVAGEPVSALSPVITPGIPRCREIKIIGQTIEGQILTVETVYSGGVEGASTYQWYRHDDQNDEFFPIPYQTDKAYVLGLADTGKSVAVEYTPISSEGIEGEPNRCILDAVVSPAPPQLLSIAITGELGEGKVLALEYEYFGGYFGNHQIQWYRKEPARSVKVGRPNSPTYTVTGKEVGHLIEVVFFPVRSDGEQGAMYTIVTEEPIRPALPAVKTIEIIGDPAVGSTLEVVAEYFGGEQGESVIQWARASPSASAELSAALASAASGEGRRDDVEEDALSYHSTRDFEVVARRSKKYVVTSEDEGRVLKVTYIPVRKDGVKGRSKQRLIEIPSPGSRAALGGSRDNRMASAEDEDEEEEYHPPKRELDVDQDDDKAELRTEDDEEERRSEP